MLIFIIAAGIGRGRIRREWVEWSLLAVLWIYARLDLVSTVYDYEFSQTAFNGLLFFTGKACVKLSGTCGSSRAYKYLFLMPCGNYMESHRVNGIFTSKVSQILS